MSPSAAPAFRPHLLAPLFRMTTATDRGCPVGGAKITIPIRFASPS